MIGSNCRVQTVVSEPEWILTQSSGAHKIVLQEVCIGIQEWLAMGLAINSIKPGLSPKANKRLGRVFSAGAILLYPHAVVFHIKGNWHVSFAIAAKRRNTPNNLLSLCLGILNNNILICAVRKCGVVIKRCIEPCRLRRLAIWQEILHRLCVVAIKGISTFDDDKSNTRCIHLIKVDSSFTWMLINADIKSCNVLTKTESINFIGRGKSPN